jgi:hypothetical protein
MFAQSWWTSEAFRGVFIVVSSIHGRCNIHQICYAVSHSYRLKFVAMPIQSHLYCPFCKGPTIDVGGSPNGGDLMVCEETNTCSDCYDPDISEFNCEHCGNSFYADPKIRV